MRPKARFNSALVDLAPPEDMTLVIEVATFEDSGEGSYTLQVLASDTAPPDGSTAPDVSAPPPSGSEAPGDIPATTAP